ncbi:MAG: glycosyltransferase family 4 protein [Gammaproteobacteria bacterium]
MEPGNQARVLFFENNPTYFLSHRMSLARAIQNLGYEVHVAAMPGPAERAIGEAGFVFHAMPLKRSGMNPFVELTALIRICSLFRKLHPDLVYQVTIKPVIYGTLAARIVRIRRVLNVISGLGYSVMDDTIKGRALRSFIFMLYRFSLRHSCQKLIFHNIDDRAVFEQKGIVTHGDSEVIPGSGVDMSYFCPSDEPAGTPLVVLPARMLRDKGVHEFVAAATALRNAGVRARFLLVGGTDPGNPSAIPEWQLRHWNAECDVEWRGQAEDMRTVYAECHVVALPSYREGLPRALVEAAACGRPVVTTDVPGCRDAVLKGKTGILVAPRDAMGLGDALRKLIEAPQLRLRMGKNGRNFVVETFAIDRIVALTTDVFKGMMAVSH